jgi:hypothetical protein
VQKQIDRRSRGPPDVVKGHHWDCLCAESVRRDSGRETSSAFYAAHNRAPALALLKPNAGQMARMVTTSEASILARRNADVLESSARHVAAVPVRLLLDCAISAGHDQLYSFRRT